VTWRRLLAPAITVTLGGCGGGGNSGDTCADMIGPGDLVITEVFADADAPSGSSGADEGREWFEIYNASSRTIDLTGLEILHSRGDGTMSHDVRLDPVSIAAGAYLVLGNVLPDLKPAHVDYGYANTLGDLYNTGIGKLVLRCGDTDIDVASYADVAVGRSRQLDGGTVPDYTANDDPSNWCDATVAAAEFIPSNFGTPGAPNQDCEHVIPGMCSDNGTLRPTVPPDAGDLVITEVMPNPAMVGDALGEWFEVRAGRAVDLNDLSLDRLGDSSDPDVIASEACLRVGIGEFAVFARSADPAMNGGLPAVSATFGFSLVGGTPSAPGDVAILAGSTLIDQVSWTGSPNGASLQVDPDFANAIDNDVEANFCDGTTPYGDGDLGTPGAANAECVFLPPPGFCDDGGTLRAIASPAVGDLAITEVMPSPNAVSDTVGEWFEIVALADFDLNGLGLDRAGDSANPNLISTPACKPVTAGSYVVFARSADSAVNGGLPPVAATFTFSLITGSTTTPGDVRVMLDTTVLDAVTWTGSASGASRQVDAAIGGDPVANDLEANFCDGATPYGAGDLGTPGAANLACGATGATCDDAGTPRPIITPVVGDLVITEVMPSPNAVSDTVGEWFEVIATRAVDLNGLGLDRAGDAAAPNVVTSATCLPLAVGDRAVFARSSNTAINGGLPPVAGVFTFALLAGSMTTPGDVRILDGATVLDAVTWTRSTAGASLQLDPDFTDPVGNDTEANFCDGATAYGAGDLGTPGLANAECPLVVPPGSCFDTTTMVVRPIDKPTTGEVVISEWMPNPALVADTAGEWLELHALADFDLNGIQLGDTVLATAPAVTSTNCVPLAAGSYALFAQVSDPGTNGGLTGVVGVFPVGVDLVNAAGTVQVGIDDLPLDVRTYATSGNAISIQLDTDLTQCNSPVGTPTYNGTDRGTPAQVHALECP